MKFADILCDRTPISEEWSESGACVWPQFQTPPAPQCAPSDESSPERPMRSRSSPVRNRSTLEDDWMPARRARSPSASSRAAAALLTQDRPASPERYKEPMRQTRHARHTVRFQPLLYSGGNSFGCRSSVTRVSAYYSVNPPALPLKLVAVAPATPPMVPGLPARSATSSPPLTSAAAALAAHLDDERCKNAVRSVLYELLTALPVSTSSSPVRHMHASRETYAPHKQHEPHDLHGPRPPRTTVPIRPAPPVPPEPPKQAQRAPSVRTPSATVRTASPTTIPEADEYTCHISPETAAWSVGSVRSVQSTGSVYSAVTSEPVARQYAGHHVATQAQAAAAAGNVRSEDAGQEQVDSADEWLGGVRALRDSHVRLVLRQLRHIERLNRALDRAARASSAVHAVDAATSAKKPTHKQTLH